MTDTTLPAPRLADRLLVTGGAALDRATLRIVELMLLTGEGSIDAAARERHHAALEAYCCDRLRRDPQAFFPAPPPPRVEVTRRSRGRDHVVERLRWRSGYRAWDPRFQAEIDCHDANAWACAEWLRHPRPGAPAVICVHSWATGFFAVQRVVFAVRGLFDAGLDVVLFILPFHGPRTPARSLFGGQLFPGTTPHRINEGVGQSIWDLRSLLAHLRREGSGPVGVMGMSLGGYTSAVLASVEPSLAFSVPIIPVVCFADLLWHHGEGRPERRHAEARGLTRELLEDLLGVHSPLRLRPVIPRERRMIVAGLGDRVCRPRHVLRLWEHWERPRIHWFPGGHVAHFGRRRVLRAIRGFIAESLDLETARPGPRLAAQVPR